jgi:predicted transcriptional regulator
MDSDAIVLSDLATGRFDTGFTELYVVWESAELTRLGESVTVSNVTTSNRQLTDLQQAIVNFIWKAGPSTAEQVREGLAPAYALKDSTIRTLLRRLEHRGYLTHTVDGKVFLYRASVPPRSLAARSVQQIIERFWSGSAEQFLAGMVDAKVLTPAQIRKLANKVKDRK